MPSRLRPESIPEEVAVAVDIIGNQARSEVLRLVALGRNTAASVAEGIDGIGVATVYRHLRALEIAGLVVGVPQAGRAPHLWEVDRAAVRDLAQRWADYVTAND